MATRASHRQAQHTETHESRLRSVRALRELISIEEAELTIAAADAGLTQRQIAAELGRSQADVHRLLRKARAGLPSETRRLILSTVAGDGTRATMVGRLRPGLERGKSPEVEQIDGYVPGALDEVRQAFMEGLLTEDEYNEIRGAAVDHD